MTDDHQSQAPSAGTREPLHVVVVGGGLGGLCLAQGLTKAGISAAVYERDASAAFRRQGYRIGLKESGAAALRACLPDNLYRLCAATALKQPTRMVFTDAHLNPKFVKPIPHADDRSGFGVNRLTLREILLAGLGDTVHFGKTFVRYEQCAEAGRVRAHFSDGASATADLLVGADGTNSAVRAALVPDAVVDGLHWAVYGRTPLTAAALEWMPDVLVDTFNRVIGPGDTAISVATCRTREPAAAATARLAPGLRLTEIPDYFSWTLPLTDTSLRDAGSTSLHAAACASVRHSHPAVQRLVAEADVAATFAVQVTSAKPVEPWRTPNVTLLGDAIHTMSPGRGEGANTALSDAQLLAEALTEVAANQTPLTHAKERYEREMLHRGFQAVSDSLRKPFAPASG